MPRFQLLRCDVAIAGDREQVVTRGRARPIVFPELPVLQHLHGDDAVTDVHVVGEWDTTNEKVLERLNAIYREEAVKAVYPGTRPRLPMGDSTIPLCTLPIHIAPPSRPDNPDPELEPLDQFTMPDYVPRVAAKPWTEPEAPEVAPGLLDNLAGHVQDEDLDSETSPLDMFAPAGPVPDKPDMPDAAAIRARGNVRGQGTSAPRTADHLPDAATGGLNRPEARSKAEARARG